MTDKGISASRPGSIFAVGYVHGNTKDDPKRKPRVCAQPGCGTILSRYNAGVKCSIHEWDEEKPRHPYAGVDYESNDIAGLRT